MQYAKYAKNMHDMQNMQTSFSICRICTAHFADARRTRMSGGGGRPSHSRTGSPSHRQTTPAAGRGSTRPASAVKHTDALSQAARSCLQATWPCGPTGKQRRAQIAGFKFRGWHTPGALDTGPPVGADQRRNSGEPEQRKGFRFREQRLTRSIGPGPT